MTPPNNGIYINGQKKKVELFAGITSASTPRPFDMGHEDMDQKVAMFYITKS